MVNMRADSMMNGDVVVIGPNEGASHAGEQYTTMITIQGVRDAGNGYVHVSYEDINGTKSGAIIPADQRMDVW